MVEVTVKMSLSDDQFARLRSHLAAQGDDLDQFVSDATADRLEELETTASVRRNLEDADAGRVRPARQAIEQLAGELGLTLDRPTNG